MIAVLYRPGRAPRPAHWIVLLACLFGSVLLIAQVPVWTWRYDNSRIGVNSRETTLTPASVNPGNFGRLFSQNVDGQIYAQPLYLPNVSIPGKGTHNVVFVATEHDSVYAFDADDDQGGDAGPLWQVSFTDPAIGVRTVTSDDLRCKDIQPETGITGTPVIDVNTGTLYVVVKTWENGHAVQRLHALDVATGDERSGSPVVITATSLGQGASNQNGVISFDPLMENQRTGLLLDHGVIYIAWASTCDRYPWHGWVIAYDAHTLQQIAAFNATPDGNGGGFWQAGAAPAADANGDVYIENANGILDAEHGGNDYSSVMLRLHLNHGQLTPQDQFIPYNADYMNASNQEPSSGIILLPDQGAGTPPLAVAASKNGSLYLLNRDQFGGFHSGSDSQIIQSLENVTTGIVSTPAYWNGFLYLIGGGEYRQPDHLEVFSLRQGRLSLLPAMTDSQLFGFPGASPVVSSNGNTDGILWALRVDGWKTNSPAVLYAWDAQSLLRLYSSDVNSSRDDPGAAVKFTVPVVANGKVYVGTEDRLSVYGLLDNDFSFSLSPGSQRIDAGEPATLTVTAPSSGAPLSLHCASPSACTINPSVVQPGESATVSIAADALPVGTQTAVVTADNGSFHHQQSATIQVQDFSLWFLTDHGTVQSGSSLPIPVRLTSDNGYGPPATLACDQLPAGMHCAFDPAAVNTSAPDSTLTLGVDANVVSGVYPIIAVAAHDQLHHSATYSLEVHDFQLQASPSSLSVDPADSATVTIAAVATVPSQEEIQLGCGPAQGATCTFQPAVIHPGQSSQLTIAHLASADAGTLEIPVTGTVREGTSIVSAQIPLLVNIVDFSLNADPAQQVIDRGEKQASFTIATQAVNHMAQPVDLSCTVAAPALCSLTPQRVTPGQSSVLTVSGLDQVTASATSVNVLAASGSDRHALTLTVGFRDFGLAFAQPSATIQPGVNSVAFDITTEALNGFNNPIQLRCRSAALLHCTFDPATVPPGSHSTATISGLSAVTGDSLQLAIEGVSSAVSHLAQMQILIGDFALSAPSYAGQVTAGQSAQFPLTLTSYNQFQGSVSFACSGAPALATCSITPATASLTGDGKAQVHLSVTTTARSVILPAPPSSSSPPWLLLGFGLAGMLAWAARPRWRPALALAFLLAAEAACGNGAAQLRGTPAGQVTLTITATSGTVHRVLPFELTVK